jgi:hypothetical protein
MTANALAERMRASGYREVPSACGTKTGRQSFLARSSDRPDEIEFTLGRSCIHIWETEGETPSPSNQITHNMRVRQQQAEATEARRVFLKRGRTALNQCAVCRWTGSESGGSQDRLVGHQHPNACTGPIVKTGYGAVVEACLVPHPFLRSVKKALIRVLSGGWWLKGGA